VTQGMREVSHAVGANMQTLAPQLLGLAPTYKGRTEWRFRSRGSLAVAIAGPKRGCWFDHEAGRGGDALDLIACTQNCGRQEAWHWALNWLGHAPRPSLPAPISQRARQASKDRGQEQARVIWGEAIAPSETPVEAYLRSRGLRHQPGAPLKFHPACPRRSERLPAMIALMTDPVTNQPVGVHRTFIRPDGRGKAPVTPAKMMLGTAGVIRLSADEEVTQGLGITEGIENGLAVLQRATWAPVWACGSAGGISSFPVLRGLSALTIFADADDTGGGLRAARACAARWCEEACDVVIQRPPTGKDWLEALEVDYAA